MENYQEISAKAQRELEEIRQKRAVSKSKIEAAAKELGIDITKSIPDQIEALKKETLEKKAGLEVELEDLLKQLEEFKAEGDGSESFD